jgi:uncharacterized protein YycO
MTVLEALHYPPTGSCVVVRTEGFVPWVIRRATRSPFDHALITVDDAGTIVEAEPSGARRGHISEYAHSRMAIDAGEPVTARQRAQIAEAADGMAGVHYDDLAIADLGLQALGWHWNWLASKAGGEHELICSALCVVAARAAGLDWLCGKTDPEQVTPGDLARRPVMRAWDLFARP